MRYRSSHYKAGVRNPVFIAVCAGGAAVLLALVGIMFAVILRLQSEKEALAASAQAEPPPFEAPDLGFIYNTDARATVSFNDGILGEVWVSALPDVPVAAYNPENYRMNEFQKYYEDGEIKSRFGIDVSSHQGVIDWPAVKASGVEFAMVRIGSRGYETGSINLDKNYKQNLTGAVNAGIPVGAYFYSQAVNVEEATDEALAVIKALEGYEITYPVVFDWEPIDTGDAARTDNITPKDLTDSTIAFCEYIKSAGYIPMFYTAKRMAYMKLDLSRLTDYQVWLAEWPEDIGEAAKYYYYYHMWQYTSEGHVDGINGNVDLNVSFVDYASAVNAEP